MTSIVEFVRRNRGKIVVGTVVAGGAYLAQKFARQYYEEQERGRSIAEQSLANAAQSAFGMDPQRMMLQNRRLYIFDSNQRTCDNSILQLIPSLKSKLQKRFDVETAVEFIQRGQQNNAADGGGQKIDEKEKLRMWEEMKKEAFARLFSSAISYTILIVSLKTQISIMAAQIYENSRQSSPGKYESWYSRVWYSLGGRPVEVKPRSGQAKRSLDVDSLSKNSSNVQQLFLQSLQYFVNKGVDSLADHIQSIITDQLSSISFKDHLSFDQFKKLLDNVRTRVINNSDTNGRRHFSFYVVPLCHTGTLPDEPILEELLILLKTVLESTDAQRVFDYGVDSFLDGALKRVVQRFPEYQHQRQIGGDNRNTNTIQLARLIPPLSDAFHEISKVNFDSIISNFLISQELNDYCTKVYDRDQNIW